MDFAARPATLADLDAISEIRLAVRENVLSDPAAITRADYVTMLAPERGACWVAESRGEILGFSWADFAARNVWALFVRPERERRGVGRAVHATMMDAFFSRSDSRVWLGTTPGTRAVAFYRAAGWIESGLLANGEVRFEMDAPRGAQCRTAFNARR